MNDKEILRFIELNRGKYSENELVERLIARGCKLDDVKLIINNSGPEEKSSRNDAMIGMFIPGYDLFIFFSKLPKKVVIGYFIFLIILIFGIHLYFLF